MTYEQVMWLFVGLCVLLVIVSYCALEELEERKRANQNLGEENATLEETIEAKVAVIDELLDHVRELTLLRDTYNHILANIEEAINKNKDSKGS